MLGKRVGSPRPVGLPFRSTEDQNEVWKERVCFGKSVRIGFQIEVLCCSVLPYPCSTSSVCDFVQLDVDISVVTPKESCSYGETGGTGKTDRPLLFFCKLGA